MLSRVAHIAAAVLSGVTASLLVVATTAQAAQNRPVVVYAEPQGGFYTERVSFSDLDLAVKSDQKDLHRRIGSAVRSVCTSANGFSSHVSSVYRACASDSWSMARPQLDRAIARAEQLALNGQPSIVAGGIAISSQLR